MNTEYISRYGIPWCFRAHSAEMAKKGKSFIINLDDETGNGTHWTAARLVDEVLYYADPFGTILNGWPPSELDRVAAIQKVNRVSFQRPSSTLCGYYSICFALAMDLITTPLSRSTFEEVLYKSIL